MNENSQRDPEKGLDAPPRLVTALKDVSRREVFVPPYVDNVILKAARQRLEKRAMTRRFHFHRWMLWPALATAFAVVALTCLFQIKIGRESSAVVEDLNHDGKVDILDSFALAREIKSGKRLPAAYDVNGDGVVDERDVQLIAAHAVQLDKKNGS